jgi:2-oxoglutarate dehydrogenase E1 component
MSRQDANAAFALTSFLYGGNAAYIDDLYARYEIDPNAVGAEWQAFFASMKDASNDVAKIAHGPSWKKPNWPQTARGELVSALSGDWSEVEKVIGDKIKAKAQTNGVEISAADVQQATRDSIHALMLIRAYRIRGHFHAKLDPLGHAENPD